MKEEAPKPIATRKRVDDRPGHEEVYDTDQPYFEADGSDVRVKRVVVFDAKGQKEGSYLQDEMGVPFKDNLG